MPSTHTSLHYHLIFATTNREPNISPAWRAELHAYLGGIVKGLDGQPEGIGGVADHVHLLVSLKPTACLSNFMRELKKASSAWVKESKLPVFQWQEGYAAFTVSASARESVQRYIANQEEHHRVKSFREELVEFLEKSGVAYAPEYLDLSGPDGWHPSGMRDLCACLPVVSLDPRSTTGYKMCSLQERMQSKFIPIHESSQSHPLRLRQLRAGRQLHPAE